MPTIALRPCEAAMSRSHFGGGVKVRKQLTPSSRINTKSVSTVLAGGKGTPGREGENGPYVTPFKKNFSSLRKKNRPRRSTFSSATIRLRDDSKNDGIGRSITGVSRRSRRDGIGIFTMYGSFSRIIRNLGSRTGLEA